MIPDNPNDKKAIAYLKTKHNFTDLECEEYLERVAILEGLTERGMYLLAVREILNRRSLNGSFNEKS